MQVRREIAMKIILTVSLMFFMFVIFSGCRLYSMIVLENPEFPDAMLPTDIDADLLKKYTVEGVIVHPRIHYADSAQTTYKLLAVFFSKTNTPVVSIKTLTISVNNTKLEYGKQIISEFEKHKKLTPYQKRTLTGIVVGIRAGHEFAARFSEYIKKNRDEIDVFVNGLDEESKTEVKTILEDIDFFNTHTLIESVNHFVSKEEEVLKYIRTIESFQTKYLPSIVLGRNWTRAIEKLCVYFNSISIYLYTIFRTVCLKTYCRTGHSPCS